MKLILDTCAFIWAISEPDKLTKPAQQLLVQDDSDIIVSAISCAEIACAVERKRIELDRPWKQWFRYYLNLNEWSLASIDLHVIEEAYSLPEPFHSDPADRIIVATAHIHSCPVVTADKKIIDYPYVETIW